MSAACIVCSTKTENKVKWSQNGKERPLCTRCASGDPQSKLSVLLAHLQAGRNDEAIKLAAGFPRLPPEHRSAILTGREAVLRPAFQRALKQDPEAQIAAAITAINAAYVR